MTPCPDRQGPIRDPRLLYDRGSAERTRRLARAATDSPATRLPRHGSAERCRARAGDRCRARLGERANGELRGLLDVDVHDRLRRPPLVAHASGVGERRLDGRVLLRGRASRSSASSSRASSGSRARRRCRWLPRSVEWPCPRSSTSRSPPVDEGATAGAFRWRPTSRSRWVCSACSGAESLPNSSSSCSRSRSSTTSALSS